jgi:hypothetical protein
LAVCIGAFLTARKGNEGDQSPLEVTVGLGDTARR